MSLVTCAVDVKCVWVREKARAQHSPREIRAQWLDTAPTGGKLCWCRL